MVYHDLSGFPAQLSRTKANLERLCLTLNSRKCFLVLVVKLSFAVAFTGTPDSGHTPVLGGVGLQSPEGWSWAGSNDPYFFLFFQAYLSFCLPTVVTSDWWMPEGLVVSRLLLSVTWLMRRLSTSCTQKE